MLAPHHMHLVIAKVTDLREEGGICYRSLPETSDDISSDLFQSFNCWFQCLPSWLAVGLPALVGLQIHLKSLLPTTRKQQIMTSLPQSVHPHTSTP